MRTPNKRSRSKSNRPKTLGNIVNRVFDSSGPEGKVRGTPQQIIEKYQFLARDAQLGNDRVAAENFQQHAEHYTRMLAQAQREQAAEQEARRLQQEEQRGRFDDRNRQTTGAGGQQNGQNSGQPQRHADQQGGTQRADDQPLSSGAFDVADGRANDDSPLVVETPENTARSEPAPQDAPVPPRNTRKPRAPRADGVEEAPKPRRAPRKPRAPKADADSASQHSAPEVKSSAAE